MKPSPSPHPCVMIVDDTPSSLKLLETTLTTAGLQVASFPNGQLALNALDASIPDVVLLDICMPGMDGFETCRRMKDHPKAADVPVIFISGLTETTDILKGFAAGGADYVSKPLREEEVRARVMLQIALRQTRRELELRNLELKAERDALRQMEHMRDELVHMIVHDMRSPLQGVLGNLQLLEESTAPILSPDDHECLTDAMASTRRLVRMVGTIVDASRMEAGKMPLHKTASDSASLINESLRTLGPPSRGQHIDVEGPSIPVTCDGPLIIRVLTNLLDNAMKYSPDGSPIRAGARTEGSRIIFYVQSAGRFIPEEQQRTIFDKYQTLGELPRRGVHSTGLGLPFCRLAVETHGGSIGMKSDPEHGNTFHFTLPA